MNNLYAILIFILFVIILLMAYPQRGTVATKNLKSLMTAMPLSKLFDAIGKYANRSNK